MAHSISRPDFFLRINIYYLSMIVFVLALCQNIPVLAQTCSPTLELFGHLHPDVQNLILKEIALRCRGRIDIDACGEEVFKSLIPKLVKERPTLLNGKVPPKSGDDAPSALADEAKPKAGDAPSALVDEAKPQPGGGSSPSALTDGAGSKAPRRPATRQNVSMIQMNSGPPYERMKQKDILDLTAKFDPTTGRFRRDQGVDTTLLDTSHSSIGLELEPALWVRTADGRLRVQQFPRFINRNHYLAPIAEGKSIMAGGRAEFRDGLLVRMNNYPDPHYHTELPNLHGEVARIITDLKRSSASFKSTERVKVPALERGRVQVYEYTYETRIRDVKAKVHPKQTEDGVSYAEVEFEYPKTLIDKKLIEERNAD